MDATAIFTIVALTAAISFYPEFRAEKSIAALKQMTVPQAKARRSHEGDVAVRDEQHLPQSREENPPQRRIGRTPGNMVCFTRSFGLLS